MEQEQTTTGTEILIKAAGPIVIASKCIVTKADGTVDIKRKPLFVAADILPTNHIAMVRIKNTWNQLRHNEKNHCIRCF